MKHFFGILLSSVLLCQSLPAFAVSNQLPVKQVSPELFHSILEQVKAQKVIVVQADAKKEDKDKDKEEKEPKTGPEETSSSFLDSIDLSTNVLANSNSGDEAALIIFAVIGLVVIVAWIPYLPVLIHDIIKGDENLKIHQLLTTQWNPFLVTHRSGGLLGLRYSFLEERLDKDQTLKMGFAVESGHYLVKENKRFEGVYWLAGPSIVIGDYDTDSLFGKIDLMGGTSFDSDLGLVSRAEFSINWLGQSGLLFGLSVGGLYLKARDSFDNLGIIYGANTGFAF